MFRLNSEVIVIIKSHHEKGVGKSLIGKSSSIVIAELSHSERLQNSFTHTHTHTDITASPGE